MTDAMPAPTSEDPRSAPPRLSLGRRILAVAIAIHLFSILTWAWPGNSAALTFTRRITGKYLLYTGLWQGWDMFAPDPLTVNAYLEARLTMGDGSTKTWTFPRMERLGVWDKFRQERYRKWAVDRIRPASAANLWSDTSRYIARLHANDPAGPPRVVVLSRHWRTLKSPASLWIPIGRENSAIAEEQFVFFHYDVRPADLAVPFRVQ